MTSSAEDASPGRAVRPVAPSGNAVAALSESRRRGCGKATTRGPRQGPKEALALDRARRDGGDPGRQFVRRGFECLLLVLLGTDTFRLLRGGASGDVKP